jgi:hypothetical protein
MQQLHGKPSFREAMVISSGPVLGAVATDPHAASPTDGCSGAGVAVLGALLATDGRLMATGLRRRPVPIDDVAGRRCCGRS